MPSISLTVPVAGSNIAAGLHATNYAALQTLLNGGLDDTNIVAGANIALSKLAPGTLGHVMTMVGGVWTSAAPGSSVPAFRGFTSYRLAALSVAAGTAKVIYDTEEIDSDGWFDLTQGRFTPLQAGKYLFVASLEFGDSWNDVNAELHLYKNGSEIRSLDRVNSGMVAERSINGSVIAVANGTTDYFEIYCTNGDAGSHALAVGATSGSYFQATFLGT